LPNPGAAAIEVKADRNDGLKSGPQGGGDDARGLLGLALSAIAVGALSGLVGSAFHMVLGGADVVRDMVLDWAHRHPATGWLVPALLAAAAAFVSRWLVRRFAPEAAGSGVQYVEAVVRGDAVSPGAAIVPVKFVGGVLALGAGLALGREGPTVQMSATIGHLWSQAFKLRPGESRVLLAAGAGAGLAAAFNAPLAGAIFVFEELLRRFELRIAVATLSACGAALVVMRVIVGDRLVFSVPPIAVEMYPGFFVLVLMGGLLGVLGVIYSRLVVAGLDVVDRMRRIPPEVVAAMVGALVGLVAFMSPTWVGSGESDVQSVLDGGHTLGAIVVLFVVRFVLGPLCYAPGLPGGLFAPLLAVGATAGIMVGIAFKSLLPMDEMPLAGYAAVGMGALFVAVVRAPLTGIALVVEMTGATALFVPLLVASASAVAVPAMLGCRPIYDTLQERDAAKRSRSAQR
jgi:CIC family chloride channel protein